MLESNFPHFNVSISSVAIDAKPESLSTLDDLDRGRVHARRATYRRRVRRCTGEEKTSTRPGSRYEAGDMTQTP